MSLTLPEMGAAQNLLNDTIKTTVAAFLTDNIDINLNYCNVQVNKNINNEVEVVIHTSVDAVIDGARITRVLPQG